MPHPNVDPALSREVEQDSLDLSTLMPGQVIRLELAEGQDYERQLVLEARLLATPPPNECPEFEVVSSEVPEEVIVINRRCELPRPDFVGQAFLVRGGCSQEKGQRPTMVHVGHIDFNRDVWLAFALPETASKGAMEYFPYVRSVSVVS